MGGYRVSASPLQQFIHLLFKTWPTHPAILLQLQSTSMALQFAEEQTHICGRHWEGREKQRSFLDLNSIILDSLHVRTGRNSSASIVTRYGLVGPGIKSRWGRDFPHLSRPALGPPSLLYNGYRVFPGGKGGRGVALTTHPHLVPRSWKSRALYLYSPSGSIWPATGWKLTLPYLN